MSSIENTASLPNIQEWWAANTPAETMFWFSAFGRQMDFLRHKLLHVVASGAGWNFEEAMKHAKVLSTHRSKSIVLPVALFERPDLGLRIVVRDNFRDWKMSVMSEAPLNIDLTGLCPTRGEQLASCYFQGFPRELVFNRYEESDRRRWSAELYDQVEVWTTVFLIMRSLGQVAAVTR